MISVAIECIKQGLSPTSVGQQDCEFLLGSVELEPTLHHAAVGGVREEDLKALFGVVGEVVAKHQGFTALHQGHLGLRVRGPTGQDIRASLIYEPQVRSPHTSYIVRCRRGIQVGSICNRSEDN